MDLLLHEVAVGTELEGGERDVGDVDLALGGAAVAVEDPHAGAAHAGHVALLEVDHASRRGEHRGHVGRDEVLAFAEADEQRAADARAGKGLRRGGRHDRDRVRADEIAHGTLRGGEEIAGLAVVVVDEVGDDLGVGLRLEGVAELLQPLALLLVVLDDAVVDDRDLALRHVRMRVGFGDAAVRRPAGVADAEPAGEPLAPRRRSPSRPPDRRAGRA